MRIGVPTEVKIDEYRVAITPAGVRELSARGHEVLVQAGAGLGSAFDDAHFQAQGAQARLLQQHRRGQPVVSGTDNYRVKPNFRPSHVLPSRNGGWHGRKVLSIMTKVDQLSG